MAANAPSLDMILGRSPMRNVLVELMVLAGGSLAIILFCLSIHPAAAALMGLLLAFVWMLLVAPRYFYSLTVATLQRKQYALAKRAITEGQIGIGLIGRSRLCRGIVIADEQRQLAFINGRLMPFNEIDSIAVQARGSRTYPYQEVWLEIALRDSARTSLKVFFDDGVRANAFCQRFKRVLGLA